VPPTRAATCSATSTACPASRSISVAAAPARLVDAGYAPDGRYRILPPQRRLPVQLRHGDRGAHRGAPRPTHRNLALGVFRAGTHRRGNHGRRVGPQDGRRPVACPPSRRKNTPSQGRRAAMRQRPSTSTPQTVPVTTRQSHFTPPGCPRRRTRSTSGSPQPSPHPPGSSWWLRSRGLVTLVSHVRPSASLAGPWSSGSTDLSRRRRGCSHPPRT
jgi:hypothetical protein